MRVFICLATLASTSACGPAGAHEATLDAVYGRALSKPEAPLKVFHLGHSLVGQAMPFMLQQLAKEGHAYHSQLGWGASLKQHFEPSVAVSGFAESNAHPAYQPLFEAIDAGDLDVFVMTEMVEIAAAVRYHDSAGYLARIARRVSEENHDTRIYLYETWHPLDDPLGLRARIRRDRDTFWLEQVLDPALETLGGKVKIHLIPAGTVIDAFLADVEQTDPRGLDGIRTAADLFKDQVHPNDLGWYLIALVHYAVLYGESPRGLPHELLLPDGSPARAPSAACARRMQDVTWEVVSEDWRTGLRPRSAQAASGATGR